MLGIKDDKKEEKARAKWEKEKVKGKKKYILDYGFAFFLIGILMAVFHVMVVNKTVQHSILSMGYIFLIYVAICWLLGVMFGLKWWRANTRRYNRVYSKKS